MTVQMDPAVQRGTEPTRPASQGGGIRLRSRQTIEVAVSFTLLMVAWEVLARLEVIPPVVFPPASAVVAALWEIASGGTVMPHLWETTQETLLGFVLGSGVGVLIGVLVASFGRVKRIVYPYIIAFQVVPKVVLAPIFITWFGFGITSKVITAAAITFFPVVVNTILGLESVEDDALLLMKSLGFSKFQTFRKLSWPTALPAIFAGLETAATIALIGAIVAEFVATERGLGLLLMTYNFQLRTDMVFALIIVVSLIGLVLYGLVRLLELRVVFWRRRGEPSSDPTT